MDYCLFYVYHAIIIVLYLTVIDLLCISLQYTIACLCMSYPCYQCVFQSIHKFCKPVIVSFKFLIIKFIIIEYLKSYIRYLQCIPNLSC